MGSWIKLTLTLKKNILKCQNHIFIPFSLSSCSPDLLPLVITSLCIGYADKEHRYFSAELIFATAMTSIIPLSYFIGMGIAR